MPLNAKKLVVIPTYNERNNIVAIIEAILCLKLPNLEILVVDDNSPDGTGRLADDLSIKYPQLIHALHRPEKSGLGSAYLAGFSWGRSHGCDVICEMDADFSHDPADLPRLLSEIEAGQALAIGSRRITGGHIEGWGLHRHVMSFAAGTLARLVLRLKTRDVTAGFRAYTSQAIDLLLASNIKSNGYAFQEETLYLLEKSRFKIKEIPVVFRDRRVGESKLSPKDAWEYFYTLWKLPRGK